MAWIKLNTVEDSEAYFNTDHIAYVAAPPEHEATRGVGACIAMIRDTRDVIPVYEEPESIMKMISDMQRYVVKL